MGSSVLQLSVSDRDASHNGPPFSFAIVDGNEDDSFQMDARGVLLVVGRLSSHMREHYLLLVQVRWPADLPPIPP